MRERIVTLRDYRDDFGSRYLGAALAPDGGLSIRGQDIGAGVEQMFGPGNREYEWVWTIPAAEMRALKAALGKGDDVLMALASRFSDEAAADLQPFLDKHEIRYEFWSRIGE